MRVPQRVSVLFAHRVALIGLCDISVVSLIKILFPSSPPPFVTCCLFPSSSFVFQS